ncbi:MAG: glycosyltransferase [Acidobacteria bacterium]|nr:glycosyltransferase [Acidobacteriota bacterium]
MTLSAVVPVRLATDTVAATIQALLIQCRGLAAEVIAVVSSEDPARDVLRDLGGESQLRVIEMAGRHSVPQLRAEGIRAARGRLVAITEDHCLFSPGWAAGLVRALDSRDAAAAGGPVENGRTGSVLDWAIYFSRYAGSMPPLRRGSTGALPGNNACYKREVLEALAPLWARGFWENDINRELVARGYVLWLEPDLVVTHNKPYRFGPYLALRYNHGRCFGGMIETGRLKRALLSPLIPLLLLIRAARAVFAKKRRRREFLLALPPLLLCYLVWFWGELVGYLCGPGQSCSQTD